MGNWNQILPFSGEDEDVFQNWYKNWATRSGIDTNPDDPMHQYDYRAAYLAGMEPSISPEDNKYHWPSMFKLANHPNRFVNGVDTTQETPSSIRTLTPTGLPSITQPEYAELPAPSPMSRIIRGLGTAAAAISPHSMGGRLGASAALMENQDEQDRLNRIRLGSSITEARERTSLAKLYREQQANEIARRAAVAKRGADWMRSSGFMADLDKSIGIPGAGEMIAFGVENGAFPVHDLFKLGQGKKTSVPITAWEHFGLPTPPPEVAEQFDMKSFLEYVKSQQEKKSVPAWRQEKTEKGPIWTNLNAPENRNRPVLGYEPASTVPSYGGITLVETPEGLRAIQPGTRNAPPAREVPLPPGATKPQPKGGTSTKGYDAAMKAVFTAVANADKVEAAAIQKGVDPYQAREDRNAEVRRIKDMFGPVLEQYPQWHGWADNTGETSPQQTQRKPLSSFGGK